MKSPQFSLLLFALVISISIDDVVSQSKWVTDATTGKQYTVLETSTLDFDENTQTCASYNAILPEPRTEEENNFLDSLNAQTFPLGLTDKEEEGVWRWDSDGALVNWQYWANFRTYGPDPNGGTNENCVVMVKYVLENDILTSSASWVDIKCHNITSSAITKKNLVCQKAEAPCRFGFQYLGGKCYRFIDNAEPWHEALATCETFGGHLAEPQTLEEDLILMGLALTHKTEYFWVGGHDLLTEGTWVWSSTQQPIGGYTHWTGGHQSDHAAEDCMLDDARVASLGWRDYPCGNKFKFICQHAPAHLITNAPVIG